MFQILSDNLPKRSSCQILNFKFKNLKVTNSLLINSKNKIGKKLFSIFFSISIFNVNHYKKKARVSFAFSPKILKKNMLLIVKNSKTKKNKNYFSIKKIRSVGLIITKKIFFKKFDHFYFQKQIINDFNFVCIEEPLSLRDNSLILKLFKKCNICICSLIFKQNFIKSITASCASSWVKLPSGSSLQVHLEHLLCIQKQFNNILQIVGGILDILPGGYKNIVEIGIKKNNLFLYL
jgi:hypothetical protein